MSSPAAGRVAGSGPPDLMMMRDSVAKKLDLSKLTDEEVQHVWDVVQRDFDLRKKEEDRLGDLKTQIEKEDTKRELLGKQSSLAESHCIRCLQPFKFLVNSKRQCLDCNLYTCKSCSRYNKKELGWVCDPCRMARVLKIGTLEWYHENVRARFKRFGSAKVMRSLFKRLNGEHSTSQRDEPNEYDTQSIPETRVDGYEDPNYSSMDATDGQHYKGMKKSRRLLTVHPFDFDLEPDDSTVELRRRSYQVPGYHDLIEGDVSESLMTEAEMATMFNQILEGQHGESEFNPNIHYNHRMSLGMAPRTDDIMLYTDKPYMRSRSLSRLSHSSCGSGSAGGLRHSSYLPGPDDFEMEEDEYLRYPLYQNHSRLQSHESLNAQALQPPEINELNRRMSAIEKLLNRLEQKVTSPLTQESGPNSDFLLDSSDCVSQSDGVDLPPSDGVGLPLSDGVNNPQSNVMNLPQSDEVNPPQTSVMDLEVMQLRQKLDELTGNISDHGLTSDEDEPNSSRKATGWSSHEGDTSPTKSPSRPSTRPGPLATAPLEDVLEQPENQMVQVNYSTESPDGKWRTAEEGPQKSIRRGSTALLSELENKIAQATASVQNTKSEVSYIQNRITALNAAGMSLNKGRKSAIPIQARRLSHDFPTSQVDSFVRNSLYRGSLTQRNPVAKPKKRAPCAKPVMTQFP